MVLLVLMSFYVLFSAVCLDDIKSDLGSRVAAFLLRDAHSVCRIFFLYFDLVYLWSFDVWF